MAQIPPFFPTRAFITVHRAEQRLRLVEHGGLPQWPVDARFLWFWGNFFEWLGLSDITETNIRVKIVTCLGITIKWLGIHALTTEIPRFFRWILCLEDIFFFKGNVMTDEVFAREMISVCWTMSLVLTSASKRQIDTIVSSWELELRKNWKFTQIGFVNLSRCATHVLYLM